MTLASKVDGVLLVVRPGHTRQPLARATVEQLKLVGAKLVGVVLNRIPLREAGYYAGNGYFYTYSINKGLFPKKTNSTNDRKEPRKSLSSYANNVARSFVQTFQRVFKHNPK